MTKTRFTVTTEWNGQRMITERIAETGYDAAELALKALHGALWVRTEGSGVYSGMLGARFYASARVS